MENNNKLKQRALSGIVWKLAEKMCMQIVQFIIQIVLARLLLPEEYGLVGLLAIFITVSDVFIQQGFTTALIQKQDVDEIDFSSVYFINIVMAIMIYLILYFCAPLIAVFYNEPILISLMRVMSLNVIIGAFGAVQNAILSKALDFKKSFFRNALNVLTQGIVGIVTACMGAGAWSLVFSKLSGTFVGTLVLCVTVKWRPSIQFSIRRVKQLFSYSSKVLITNLLNTVFNNIHSLIIGRYYTSADLGYYQKGQQIPQTVMTAIDGSFSEVLYPTLSIVQNDSNKLKNTLRRSMKTSMYLVLPMLVGIIAVAEPVTLLLLTDKWLPCVPFIRLQCVVCMFWPLAARTHALNAIGKSDVTLKLSIVSKVLTLIFIFNSINFGIYAIMLGTIVASFVSFWITSYYVKKYINYSALELIKDIFPSILMSFVMMVIVILIGMLEINFFLKVVIQVGVGIIVYIGESVFFRYECFFYLLEVVKRFMDKK